MRTRVMFLAWGYSIHAERRIKLFADDPSFEVIVVSTHAYNFANAVNVLLTGPPGPVDDIQALRPEIDFLYDAARKMGLERPDEALGDVCQAVYDYRTLLQAYNAHKPDVVFLQTLLYPCYLSYFLPETTPIVVTFWNGDVIWWAKWNGIDRLYKKLIVTYGARRAAAITVNSQMAFDACLEYGVARERINLIRYPGLERKRFHPRSRTDARQELGIGSQHVVLCPRGLGGYLNSDIIIEAASLVVQRFPETLFLFSSGVGREQWDAHLDKARELGIEHNLRHDGQISWDRMPLYYAAADLMVSVSSNDSLPNCMLEAMGCGTPVVMTDIPQIREWVTDGVNGYLVPDRNPQALAGRIIALIASPEVAGAFVRHNLDLVSREADSALNVAKVKQLVRRVAGTSDSPPLFSILVPAYNQADFLREALDSLLAQSFPDWEALVVNDGSTDHTRQVMEAYASRDRRIRIFHKENGGVASALNRGVREAQGRWVCWLSSDDLFEPDKLRIHHEALVADPSVRFMHTNFSLFHEESRTLVRDSLRTDLVIPPQDLQLLYFLRFNYINGISIAIRRDVFDEVGLFDEALRCGQDYDMWLRITARYPSAFIDRHTCVTRVHPGQGTHQFVEAGIFDSCRAAVGFLNAHPFADLFPLLDLNDPAQAMRAVEQTLCVLADEHAYVNLAGFGPLLADRLLEWCSGQASSALRPRIADLAGRAAELVRNAGSPGFVAGLLAHIGRQVGEPVRFTPRDFFGLLETRLGELRSEGRAREGEAVEKYLSRNTDQRERTSLAGGGRRLTLLFVLHNFPPHNHAGVEIYSYLMARELHRQGHEVSVFYPYLEPGAEPVLLTEEFDGIRVHRLRTPGPREFAATLTDPVIEELFARFIAAHRFDLVHFHHTQLLLPITLIELARMQGVRTALTLHDFWYICLRTHLFTEDGTVCAGPDSFGKCAACWRSPVEAMERFLSSRAGLVERILAGVDLLTAPSRFVADRYRAYGCSREIAVAPLGVRRCPPGGRGRTGVTFGYLGTIHPLKNVVGLVEAFQRTAGPHARLLIYGGGDPSHLGRLRSAIADGRVEYRGGYGAEDICGILDSVDMAVVPSFIESYCMTAREALNAGIPVIAANVGGIPEAVIDGVNGFLFDPHDLEQLTRLLQTVIDAPEIIGRLRANISPVKTIEDDALEWSGRYLRLRRS